MSWPYAGDWQKKGAADLPVIFSSLCRAVRERGYDGNIFGKTGSEYPSAEDFTGTLYKRFRTQRGPHPTSYSAEYVYNQLKGWIEDLLDPSVYPPFVTSSWGAVPNNMLTYTSDHPYDLTAWYSLKDQLDSMIYRKVTFDFAKMENYIGQDSTTEYQPINYWVYIQNLESSLTFSWSDVLIPPIYTPCSGFIAVYQFDPTAEWSIIKVTQSRVTLPTYSGYPILNNKARFDAKKVAPDKGTLISGDTYEIDWDGTEEIVITQPNIITTTVPDGFYYPLPHQNWTYDPPIYLYDTITFNPNRDWNTYGHFYAVLDYSGDYEDQS